MTSAEVILTGIPFAATLLTCADAAKLGASRFIDVTNKLELASISERLDFIVSTTYVQHDWKLLLNCLKPNGVLCLAGEAPKNLKLPIWPLLYKQRKVVG